jgi:hypothetical protein
MAGQGSDRIGSRSVLRAFGRGLCAFGVLAAILSGSIVLSGEPLVLAPQAPTGAEIGLAAAVLGALLWGVGGLRQRLIETEHALAETRARLEAAMAALAASGAGQKVNEPVFRSRPAGRRRSQRPG